MTPALVTILLALVLANLPFAGERVLGVKKPAAGVKHGGWRALELVLLYGVFVGVARLIEAAQQPVQAQHWEFYAVTFCLFVVFAFPGFVLRYLWKGKGALKG